MQYILRGFHSVTLLTNLRGQKISLKNLMNFVNSWLAEPWEQTEVKMNSKVVLDRQTGLEENIIPDAAQIFDRRN